MGESSKMQKSPHAGFFVFHLYQLNLYKLAIVTKIATKEANNPQMVIWAVSNRRLLVGGVRLFSMSL
jgi:hypothetical protein